MADAIRWLRISYWVRATIDALAAAQTLCVPLFELGMRPPRRVGEGNRVP